MSTEGKPPSASAVEHNVYKVQQEKAADARAALFCNPTARR